MKITAIVPAYNEEKNIGRVLKVLLKSFLLNEVIVVDDGSRDKTAEVSQKLGAKVIKLSENKGKGMAMREGVKSADAEIIAFFDADLIGLVPEHVSLLVKPVLEGKAEMSIALRDRWFGLAGFFIKLDPLTAIGGERAMRRFVFESLPQKFIKGFAVETSLNYYCLKKKLRVVYPYLKGLDIIIKEKKWGFLKGFLNRLKMIWQLLEIRIIILFSQKEFE